MTLTRLDQAVDSGEARCRGVFSHIRCPPCSLSPGALGSFKGLRFKGKVGRIPALALGCSRIPVRCVAQCRGGAEEESIGFRVCSRGCSFDDALQGLLGHLSIPRSAKPALQTHV